MPPSPLLPIDLYRVVMHADVQIAGDGALYFVRTTQNEAEDRAETAIWRSEPGAAPAPFTTGPNDKNPRLSPDGRRLAFVSGRGEGVRVYLMPTAGGEARALSPVYDAVTAPAWSTDDRIAFVATAPPDPATARVYRDERSEARHIRALPFKSDADGILDGRRKHLFVMSEGGEPRQVTHGDFDVQTPVWAPDGSRIAFSAIVDRPENTFAPDLYVVDPRTSALQALTGGAGPALSPSFSHDGRRIAFIGHRHGDESGGRFNLELFVIGSQGGEARSLTAGLDRPVGDFVAGDVRSAIRVAAPIWSGDDRELFVAITTEGRVGIIAVACDGSSIRTVADGERHIAAFARNDGGTLGLVYSTPLEPSTVARIDAAGTERGVVDDNAWIRERTLAVPSRERPAASDGTQLDMWLLAPKQPADAPLVLEVHGGPHAAYGYGFFFEFQMLQSLGFAVAYGNPRGSQGYGERYARCITGGWGETDAGDVLRLLDAAQDAGPWDRSRTGLAGGSYGGFMTTWLLGHSRRFAAGISMRAVNDFLSEYTASDINRWIGEEVGAGWEDAGRRLFERSPIRAAAAIDVPLLIEHSERDLRCPVDQADSLFTLLRNLGRRNVEFVRFTGDGHELSRAGKPRNRVLRLRAIAHWFIRHLRPAGIESVPDEAGALFKPLPLEEEAESAAGAASVR